MAVVSFRGDHYQCEDGVSLLDTLLQNQVLIPHSCKSGVCNTCLMRCDHGDVGDSAVKGLDKMLITQGYFLSCQCFPEINVQVSQVDDYGLFGRARVIDKTMLSPAVCRIRLQPANPLYYRAGQYVNLRNVDGIIRSYSLASLPASDDFLELHVKRMPNGVLSNWIVDFMAVGDKVDFQGPNGLCFYNPDTPDARLLLAGTGTGLAPLIGVVRDALNSGHRGDIHLYHGEKEFSDLYLHNYLEDLQDQFDNFLYFPCLDLDSASGQDNVHYGKVLDIALSNVNSFESVYLCGSPAMVHKGQKMAYLGGVSMENIHVDPFETRDLRSQDNQSGGARVGGKRVGENVETVD